MASSRVLLVHAMHQERVDEKLLQSARIVLYLLQHSLTILTSDALGASFATHISRDHSCMFQEMLTMTYYKKHFLAFDTNESFLTLLRTSIRQLTLRCTVGANRHTRSR